MKERLLAYCEMKGITPNAFETRAGWSPSTIYNLKKGVRSDKLADAALAFPDLDIRWLLTGQGSPIYETLRTEQHSISQQKVVLNDIHDNPQVIVNFIQHAVKDAIKEAYLEIKKDNK